MHPHLAVLLLITAQAYAQLALPALALAPYAETVEVSEHGTIKITKRKKKKKTKAAGKSGGATERLLKIGVDALVKRTKAERKRWSKDEAARMADADDYKDSYFQPKRPGNHQLAPVTSTIDGGRRFQILRTGYGSSLRVNSVRFEFGVAMDESSNDPRDALGGALCVSGNLTLNNSIVRSNRAINGGGLYTEGYTRLRHSVLTDNFADQCGGLIYTAGVASVDSCEVGSNTCGHFDCKKMIKEKELEKQKQKAKTRAKGQVSSAEDESLPSWRRREPKPTSGGFGDDDEDEDAGTPSRDADASGAIAEGPPLTGAPTVSEEDEEADAE